MAGALTARQADIEDAERIIDSMLRDYTKAQHMRLAAPGIAALRRHVDQAERQELAHALARLDHLSAQDHAVIERFGARLVDKMFHHLVQRIRTLAEYDEIPPETTMRVLLQLFADPDTK
jgi:glutamyl-tRNA reductase